MSRFTSISRLGASLRIAHSRFAFAVQIFLRSAATYCAFTARPRAWILIAASSRDMSSCSLSRYVAISSRRFCMPFWILLSISTSSMFQNLVTPDRICSWMSIMAIFFASCASSRSLLSHVSNLRNCNSSSSHASWILWPPDALLLCIQAVDLLPHGVSPGHLLLVSSRERLLVYSLKLLHPTLLVELLSRLRVFFSPLIAQLQLRLPVCF